MGIKLTKGAEYLGTDITHTVFLLHLHTGKEEALQSGEGVNNGGDNVVSHLRLTLSR
jgi:hypothetical protein